ncbi:MAG: F0F1 ATP synthase subunit delta, partial [Patescibacteria group bacterium]
MKSVSKDARGFVEGVIRHLKRGSKNGDMTPKVTSLLLKMSASAKHEHQARVESAVKLTQDETQSIARTLSRIAGHEVSLTSEVNPALIGGLRVTMADWVMDSSIRNELKEMAPVVT